MLKDTAEFSQVTNTMACREYTLQRDEELNRKVGSEGTPKLARMEVTTCCSQGKCGVETRIMSMNKNNSHSWVSISHGLNKLITNLSNNGQETSEMQFEKYALKLNAGDFASRSKATAKQQKRDSADLFTRTIRIGKRTWTDVEQGKFSVSDYEVSKKLIHRLRHGNQPRENDEAIELWRIKNDLQKYLPHCPH